jgi:hypothetical protein
MKYVRKLWHSIRRNPVINAVILAALTQFFQDYVSHEIDWTHFWSYAATLAFGVMAREFTVPLSEHQSAMATIAKEAGSSN